MLNNWFFLIRDRVKKYLSISLFIFAAFCSLNVYSSPILGDGSEKDEKSKEKMPLYVPSHPKFYQSLREHFPARIAAYLKRSVKRSSRAKKNQRGSCPDL